VKRHLAIVLGGKTGQTAPLDVVREVGRLLLRRDPAALAAGEGGLSLIDGGLNFGPAALLSFS